MISANRIGRAVLQEIGPSGMTVAHLMGQRRGSPRATRLRWLTMWIWWNEVLEQTGTQPSWSAVGREFDRDRSSVRHGINKVSDEMETILTSAQLAHIKRRMRA